MKGLNKQLLLTPLPQGDQMIKLFFSFPDYMGPGKSMYMVALMFRFPLPARLQWLEPAGRKRKSADIEQKMYTLIYPDPDYMAK